MKINFGCQQPTFSVTVLRNFTASRPYSSYSAYQEEPFLINFGDNFDVENSLPTLLAPSLITESVAEV